ncbi:MAG: sensor histidine kinase [Limnohabitans sp.]|nr:sensor histidine kinase [Limnohabitans sp.]
MLFLSKIKFILATIFIVAFSYAQNIQLRALESSISNNQIENANTIISKLQTKKLSEIEQAQLYYLKANLYKSENKDDLSYENYLTSKKYFQKLDSIDKVAQIDIELVSLLVAINKNTIDYNLYVNEFLEYAKHNQKPAFLSKAYMQLGKTFYNTNPNLAITYFKKAYRTNAKTSDRIFGARILQNTGATYASDQMMKLDSALLMYQKALSIYKTQLTLVNKEEIQGYIFDIYTNIGVALTKKKNYTAAITNFLKADSIPSFIYKNKRKEALYGFLSETYRLSGDYKKALEFTDKQKVYQDILDENELNKAIRDIDVKYKTEEKEIENQSLKEKLFKNTLALKITFLVIVLLLFLAFMIFKNATKKRKIIEQQRKIEVAELENKLKDQELLQIDKMIEGQEKERQRIAEELHDQIGNLLTTLKMNLHVLKNDPNTSLFEKTDQIIDETYKEVRNIAHLNNTGVIGNNGLYQAVNQIAEKMSVRRKINFQVIPFGLDKPIDNGIEILLFRTIQELCTNILKYAEATEVMIYLNQYDDSEINVIVEDNGKGFEVGLLKTTKGIGLKNIERRIEQRNGTFSIDTATGRGTSIIINLPL